MSDTERIDWVEVGRFWVFIVQLCAKFHGSVTSGPRSELRNSQLPGSSPQSKHLIRSGWGMAADIVFDLPFQREGAVKEIEEHPLYGYHIGDHYGPCQLHVQGWKYGEHPHRRT